MRGSYTNDAVTLNYVEHRQGNAVVFLHPTPLDHRYWLPMIAQLPGVRAIAPVRAILPDFRGHGASELGANLPVGGFARVPDAPVLSMGQLAADVLALLDKLEIEKAVFAGCSIGGYVLLELWRRAPRAHAGAGLHLLQASGRWRTGTGQARREHRSGPRRRRKRISRHDGQHAPRRNLARADGPSW